MRLGVGQWTARQAADAMDEEARRYCEGSNVARPELALVLRFARFAAWGMVNRRW